MHIVVNIFENISINVYIRKTTMSRDAMSAYIISKDSS